MASPVMIDEEFYPGRVEFFPERRGCCTCELRDKVKRLLFRVSELERKLAGIEGKMSDPGKRVSAPYEKLPMASENRWLQNHLNRQKRPKTVPQSGDNGEKIHQKGS